MKNSTIHFLCCLTTMLAVTVAALAAGEHTAPAQLPITSITLYRSGVGYFEREGSITAGDDVQLRFATDQINDMLKSMVILDPQQALQSVTYDSKEPLARQLASFGVDLADNPSLPTILGRLRGTRVKIVTNDGPVAGIILGGERREQAYDSAQQAIDIPFLNVVTDTGVRSINLTTMVSVQLESETLNAELTKALAALASHTTDRFKSVDLAFGGKGTRPVRVAYVNEMPIWKTSYRLVLPDAVNTKEKPLIQGWAIVENTTDDDWTGVRLALVASQPVSFQMDLSESLHINRPTLAVPMVAGAAPRIYQDGDAFQEKKKLMAMPTPGSPPVGSASSAPARPMKKLDAGSGGAFEVVMDAERGALLGARSTFGEALDKSSAAVGGEVGESFQYTLKDPISIARQQSAMLPILTSAIDGRRVSIFNRDDQIDHPMRGVEITNSSGLQLIPGPIAVFDGSTYAGDAEIGFLTLNDKRLLAYAVDLAVSVAIRDESSNTVRAIRIVDGLVEQTHRQVNTVSYAFVNKDETRDRTLLVEVQKQHDWQLTAPAKPAQETANLYRFEVTLPEGESGTLVVTQERTALQHIGVVGYDMPTLLSYATDGKVSAAVVDAIRNAAQLQGTINATSEKIARLEQERQAIDADQNRIRQNMTSISHDTDVYRRYLAKFDEQETRLEAIHVEVGHRHNALSAQREELAAYLRALNVS
ncbi:MAG: hypothetical protein EXS17_06535 [Phycisphaerales bacterium]|nr:hypothetical protein [Phycisphaerales bacterium]